MQSNQKVHIKDAIKNNAEINKILKEIEESQKKLAESNLICPILPRGFKPTGYDGDSQYAPSVIWSSILGKHIDAKTGKPVEE